MGVIFWMLHVRSGAINDQNLPCTVIQSAKLVRSVRQHPRTRTCEAFGAVWADARLASDLRSRRFQPIGFGPLRAVCGAFVDGICAAGL